MGQDERQIKKEIFADAMMNCHVIGFYLNLEEGTYTSIEPEKSACSNPFSHGEWNSFADEVTSYVLLDDQNKFIPVSKIESVTERLKKEDHFSVKIRYCVASEERWFRYVVLRGEDKRHAVIVFLDITDEIFQASTLKEEKLFLKSDSDSSFASWSVSYRRDHTASKVEWSDAMRHMLGFENTDDFPNTTDAYMNCVHPADLVETYKRTVIDVSSFVDRKYYFQELRLRNKDGEYHWYRNLAHPVRREDGSIAQFYGVLFDIDEVKKAKLGIDEALDSLALNKTMLNVALRKTIS